eukprot:scaffold88351_cov39-Attheya_sp.AAC.1
MPDQLTGADGSGALNAMASNPLPVAQWGDALVIIRQWTNARPHVGSIAPVRLVEQETRGHRIAHLGFG